MWTEPGWTELVHLLGRFDSAVLTALDPTGHPIATRCRPRADHARRVLRCGPAVGLQIADGPGSLLCHSHDDELWSLRSFLVRGTLQAEGEDLVLTPHVLVPGTGLRGPLADARGFLAARRRAGRYLARRALARPRIPWSTLRARP